ncbi:hypothetical protein BGZ95_011343 [Linnemannia exigua]|uniref:Uncharacterized protein n=1 Tax=Linnemannia exigua TaxID=604196 RepID=A0AAD4H5P8_9FUNG|nr:hypothetical protein BGZ95_011343 [Linnemannia exigua]
MMAKIPIHGQHGCGSWIQDYIEYQNGIVDEILPARYTVHACSSTDIPSQQHEQKEQQEQRQQPCGDLFSQMIAMTSAFAWSVKESRGFFLRLDQILHLQDSFWSPVLQHQWSLPPSLLQSRQKETKGATVVKVDTEEMATRELVELFGLEDALFSGLEDEDEGEGGVQGRLWALRSKSRNRASFERTLSAPNDPITNPYQPTTSSTLGGQSQIGKAITSSRMKELKDGLESDGVELVVQQDLLPLFINTTTTLDQFVDLGLPLPDHILVEHQARQTSSSSNDSTTTTTKLTSIRAPSAHGSLFSSSSSGRSSSSSSSLSGSGSNGPTHQAITTALNAALHDTRDMSRIQAAPKSFGCLLDILLQPQLDLQHLIHPYATLFKLPAVFSIGIFIKSDSASSPPSKTPHSPSWKSMSVDRQRTVDRYLTCARQIAREFAPKRKGQKIVYVVVSEDAGMARVMESQEEWDEEVITPSWGPYKDYRLLHHPRRRPSPPFQPHPESENNSKQQLTQQQQQVLENWVLSKTDFQVVSDQSDFAKVAVWRTRREGRSVVIRENSALETFMKGEDEGGGGYVDMLDCGTLLNNLAIRD